MSLPSYPEYKDSGVAWLGEVPSDWELKRLGYFFEERREKVSDKDYPALSVTKNGIVPQIETAAKTDDGDNRKKVCAGDFVINSRSDRKGSSGISSLDGSVSLINTILRPREQVFPAYIHHLLRSVPFQEEFYRYGKGIVADLWSTNYSEMRGITLAMPSAEEQTAIATFLDRETAKIDALIAEQEKLLTLLAEKRQATISHAVTKGLNPDVPMKDSGVEWLGEVPAHWESWKMSQAFGCIGSGTTPPSDEAVWYSEGTIPWITTGELRESIIYETTKFVTVSALNKFSALKLHPAGSLAIAMYGATIGRLGILGVDATTNQACCVLSHPRNLNVRFVFYWLYGFKQILIDLYATGGGQPNINQDTVASLRIPAPGLSEQAAIATFLERETTKIDALTTEATLAITVSLQPYHLSIFFQ